MRQSERHHRDLMKVQNRNGSVRYDASGGHGSVQGPVPNLLFWVAVGLLGIAVCAAVIGALIGALISFVTAVIQGMVAAAIFGGIVGAVTYLVLRRRTPTQSQFARPDKSLRGKDRAVAAYRSLDPVTGSAVKVGAIAGAAAFMLSVLL